MAASGLNRLPVEIVEEIAKYLDKLGLLSVRATCQYADAVLLPRILSLVAIEAKASGWVNAYLQKLAEGHLHDILALFLLHQPPLNELDTRGQTALHVAARSGCVECVRRLLDAGADPNVVDRSRWTPLMLAARYGHFEVAERLLQAGADVNRQVGFRRWTPLHLAVRNSREGVAALLLAAGADDEITDDEGIPAREAFARQGRVSGPAPAVPVRVSAATLVQTPAALKVEIA